MPRWQPPARSRTRPPSTAATPTGGSSTVNSNSRPRRVCLLQPRSHLRSGPERFVPNRSTHGASARPDRRHRQTPTPPELTQCSGWGWLANAMPALGRRRPATARSGQHVPLSILHRLRTGAHCPAGRPALTSRKPANAPVFVPRPTTTARRWIRASALAARQPETKWRSTAKSPDQCVRFGALRQYIKRAGTNVAQRISEFIAFMQTAAAETQRDRVKSWPIC